MFTAICILSIIINFIGPNVFELFLGNKIIDNHISELNLRDKSIDDAALTILRWQKDNVVDPVHYFCENPILKFNINRLLHIVKIDNEYRPFIKTTKASWTIFLE